MSPDPAIAGGDQDSLRRARVRVAQWRSRVAAVRNLLAEPGAEPLAARVAPLLQQLKDRCDRTENEVLRLQRLERARTRAEAGLGRSWSELDRVWLVVHRALESARGARSGGRPLWPFREESASAVPPRR